MQHRNKNSKPIQFLAPRSKAVVESADERKKLFGGDSGEELVVELAEMEGSYLVPTLATFRDIA